MARNSIKRGKLVRKFGQNIFGNAKYDRLLKRKPKPPGAQMRRGRKRISEFGKQLIEKQKLKFSYGLSEKQFRNLFFKAKSKKGVTGDNMLVMLEQRLDSVLYRAGFACSRNQARQLATHGQFLLNDRRVDIPSIQLRPGDVLKVRPKKNVVDLCRRLLSENSIREIPEWIGVSPDDLTVSVHAVPPADKIPVIAEIQLIVEYYSK